MSNVLDELARLEELARLRQRQCRIGNITLDDRKFLQMIKTVRDDAYARGRLKEREHNDRNMATNPLLMRCRRKG